MSSMISASVESNLFCFCAGELVVKNHPLLTHAILEVINFNSARRKKPAPVQILVELLFAAYKSK